MIKDEIERQVQMVDWLFDRLAEQRREDMTREVEGTAVELWRLRQVRRSTAETIATMEMAGLDPGPVQSTYNELMDTVVMLAIPCIICKRRTRLPATVAGDELPMSFLCEECNAKVNEEVARSIAGTTPRRKRRTKAEMAAARAAQTTATEAS